MGASGGTLGFGKGGNFQNKTGGGANSKSSMPPNAHRKVTYIPIHQINAKCSKTMCA